MTLRHVGTLVLALSLVVCAPAYAGNGNGKDNGNSASAPGQVKKEQAAADAAAQAQVQAQTQTPAAVAPTAATAAEIGVKPSNDTAKDTHEQAASDKTKEYGNGKAAGQIAMQNGAAPTTSLHGPGNSQPHKAAPCAGGHEVDVHALKAKRGGSCGSSPPAPTPTPKPTPHPTPVSDPGPGPKQVVPPTSSSPAPSRPSTPTVVVGGGKPKPTLSHGAKADSGIPGSTGAVAGATLPFTGLDLWSAALIGVLLILIGLALCRRAATVPVYKSEREERP